MWLGVELHCYSGSSYSLQAHFIIAFSGLLSVVGQSLVDVPWLVLNGACSIASSILHSS